ncbi:MAG: sigma-E factor negative regulatory protein [Gammaproteobacteria bacterium]|jgi:negative regulator of sigma E activity
MTTDIEKNEQLSAFVDGELNREHCDHIISGLCNNQDTLSCFERYQIISDTMRSQLPVAMKRDFADCVKTAIESEPAILAPALTSKKSGFSTHITKKVAGFAIAASVATIAVIGVQLEYQDNPQQVATMPDNSEFVRLAKEQPANTVRPPLMVPAPQNQNGFSTASTIMSRQQLPQGSQYKNLNPQLHQYIVIHSQQVAGAGMHDIISSARIVSSSQQQHANQVQR